MGFWRRATRTCKALKVGKEEIIKNGSNTNNSGMNGN
jgi:hypothetical protein